MVEHELLFLGLLMEKPKHGYDIKLEIKDELSPVIGLEIKSIYYPLKKLEKSGLIKNVVGKEGNWPEKNVYSITAKGRKRFDEIITRSFLSIERPYFHINLSLYFINYVDREEARRRMKARVALLKKVRQRIVESFEHVKDKPGHLASIIQHDLDLCDAEILSITRLIESI
ncbi:MAG: PadR family transcriptional regulator [Candidatus Omnitrophica bacterium]|nr:PadR family transcriptional regulator [Candidatus Omnitrophota bacterium]